MKNSVTKLSRKIYCVGHGLITDHIDTGAENGRTILLNPVEQRLQPETMISNRDERRQKNSNGDLPADIGFTMGVEKNDHIANS